MDHKRIKRFAWSRWIRASELALQAKQAKATADRHLIGKSPVSDMRNSANLFRGRVCILERRYQAKVISSYYVSRIQLVHAGWLLIRSGVSEGGFVRYLRRLTLLASHHLSEEPQPLAGIVIMSRPGPLPHEPVYIPQTLRRHRNRSLRNLPTAVCGRN
jgi:hypothetical protein